MSHEKTNTRGLSGIEILYLTLQRYTLNYPKFAYVLPTDKQTLEMSEQSFCKKHNENSTPRQGTTRARPTPPPSAESGKAIELRHE